MNYSFFVTLFIILSIVLSDVLSTLSFEVGICSGCILLAALTSGPCGPCMPLGVRDL